MVNQNSWKQTARKFVVRHKCEIILASISVGIVSVALYLIPWNILPVFIPTFCATFGGVFLSFLLINCVERRKTRKAAKHTLALIWLELKYDDRIVEDISRNLGLFPRDKVKDLKFVAMKLSSLRNWASRLEDKSYYASQQSRAFFEIKGDKLYNLVNSAYYDLKFLQEVLLAAEQSTSYFDEAASFFQLEKDAIPQPSIAESVEKHIAKCKKEAKISLTDIRCALDE